jgi:ethanolamine utilization cobalamin adenosyltransferase
MPSASDGTAVVWLNRCRCAARSAELAACRAFDTPEGNSRPDLLRALNRLSSSIYLLMIEEKAKQGKR